MTLSEEDRRRIEEEEMFRVEARLRAEARLQGRARDTSLELQEFICTALGEGWADSRERINPDDLENRLEDF